MSHKDIITTERIILYLLVLLVFLMFIFDCIESKNEQKINEQRVELYQSFYEVLKYYGEEIENLKIEIDMLEDEVLYLKQKIYEEFA